MSDHANSRLQSRQLFLPSLSVLGRDYCSSTNLAGDETARSDLATNRGQTDCVVTRELIKRVRRLHGGAHLDQAAPMLSGERPGFRNWGGARLVDRCADSVPA